MSRRDRLQAIVAFSALFGAGLLVVLAAARNHSYLLPAQKHTSRSWIEGPFAPLAWHQGQAVVALDLVVMCGAYLAIIRLGERIPARWVVAAAAATTTLFVLAPPLFSTDVFDYIDYARLAVIHHLSPYTHAPSEAPGEAIYPFVHWRQTSAAYGPLFIAGSYPLGLVSPAVALWVFKVIAGASSLGCGALVWRLARRLGRPPTAALAGFTLNPLLLVWGVGGAHNDLLMLLLMLGGIVLVSEQRAASGAMCLVASAAIKATGGLAVVFAFAGSRDRRRFAAGALLLTAAVAGLAAVIFPDHALGLFRVLHREQSLVSSESLPSRVASLLGESRVSGGVHLGFALLTIGGLAVLLRRAWHGSDWRTQLGWAFLTLIVLSSWIVPWYTLWALPLAVIAPRRRLLVATLAVQGYLMAATLIIVHR